MEKFYRVIKDVPAWELGAIVRKENDSDGYRTINKIWDKEYTKNDYYESQTIVENATEYFQRVYPVNLITKTVYKLKAEAKELLAKNYSE
jgi:hypothetical protein